TNGAFHPGWFRLSLLEGRRDNARADRLGEHENIPWHGSGVRINAFRIDETCDRIAEFHFGIANGVPADHNAFCFRHLCQAATHDLLKDFKGGVLRETHDRESSQRAPSHRVDITESIGRRNLAEGKWVIHQWSK